MHGAKKQGVTKHHSNSNQTDVHHRSAQLVATRHPPERSAIRY